MDSLYDGTISYAQWRNSFSYQHVGIRMKDTGYPVGERGIRLPALGIHGTEVEQ